MAASTSNALTRGEFEHVVNDGAPLVRLYSKKELTFSTESALERGLKDILQPVIDMANTADFVREVAEYQKIFLAIEAYNNYDGPGQSAALGTRTTFIAQHTRTHLKPVACSNIHASAPFWQKLAASWRTERRSQLVRSLCFPVKCFLAPISAPNSVLCVQQLATSHITEVCKILFRRSKGKHELEELAGRDELVDELVKRWPNGKVTAERVRNILAELVRGPFGASLLRCFAARCRTDACRPAGPAAQSSLSLQAGRRCGGHCGRTGGRGHSVAGKGARYSGIQASQC